MKTLPAFMWLTRRLVPEGGTLVFATERAAKEHVAYYPEAKYEIARYRMTT